MPRIAASLAVFLTVVTCIGYNTARYPIVWEMVALPDGFAQAHQPAPSATAQQSADTASSDNAGAPSWESDWSSQDEAPASNATAASSPRANYDSTSSSQDGSYGDEYASYSDENSYSQGDAATGDDSGSESDYASHDSEGYTYDEPSSYDASSRYGAPATSGGTSSYTSQYDSDAGSYSRGESDGVSGADEGPSPSTEGGGVAYEEGPVDRVAMRNRPASTTAEPKAHPDGDSVDPVAPLRPSPGAGAPGDGYGGYSAGSGGGVAGEYATRDRAGDNSGESGSQARFASSPRAQTSPQSAAQSSQEFASQAPHEYGMPPSTAPESGQSASDSPASTGVAASTAGRYAYSPPETSTGSSETYDSSGSTDAPGEKPAVQPTADPVSGDVLVPIKPVGSAAAEPKPGDGPASGDAGDASGTSQVRRLPPVDYVATLPGTEAQPMEQGTPVAAYPPAGGE